MKPIMKQAVRCRGAGVWMGLILALSWGPGEATAAGAGATNAPPVTGAVVPPGGPNRTDFSSFRLVTERNIFNSKRSGRPRERTRETPRAAQADALRLVGTMQADGGRLAFFDGSSGDYRKALRCGGSVAGHTVVAVEGTRVTLEKGSNRVELVVGMQLRRVEGAEWQVVGEAAAPASGGESRASVPSDSDAAKAGGESGGGGDADEVLKRLMQQREKELQ